MILSALFAFCATIAFGLLFNTPRRVLIPGGITGAVGYIIFLYLRDILGYSSPMSNFMGTIVLAIMSEIFARVWKEPVIVFSVPGIIPLVPGLPMYQGMTLFMMHAYNPGIDKFMSAAADAGAIAFGVLLISSIARLFKNPRIKMLEKGIERK